MGKNKVYCRDCIHRRLINQLDRCYHPDEKDKPSVKKKNIENACKDHEE